MEKDAFTLDREMEVAKGVAERLRKVPGSIAEAHWSVAHAGAMFVWVYNCPCGEQSGLQMMVVGDTLDVQGAINHYYEHAIAAMRRHVRSEGNEPSF